MAASTVAVTAAIDAALVDRGLLYDGSDGFIGTLTGPQLDDVIRVVKAAGGHLVVTSGVITIVPAPTDTQGD